MPEPEKKLEIETPWRHVSYVDLDYIRDKSVIRNVCAARSLRHLWYGDLHKRLFSKYYNGHNGNQNCHGSNNGCSNAIPDDSYIDMLDTPLEFPDYKTCILLYKGQIKKFAENIRSIYPCHSIMIKIKSAESMDQSSGRAIRRPMFEKWDGTGIHEAYLELYVKPKANGQSIVSSTEFGKSESMQDVQDNYDEGIEIEEVGNLDDIMVNCDPRTPPFDDIGTPVSREDLGISCDDTAGCTRFRVYS